MRFSLWGSKNTVVFWHQQWLGGWRPLLPKIWPPLQRRNRHTYCCHLATASDSDSARLKTCSFTLYYYTIILIHCDCTAFWQSLTSTNISPVNIFISREQKPTTCLIDLAELCCTCEVVSSLGCWFESHRRKLTFSWFSAISRVVLLAIPMLLVFAQQ